MKRLFFVCPEGHIFRSLKSLKQNRRRVCGRCDKVVASGGFESIADARNIALEKPFSKSYIQVFVKGQMKIISRYD